MTNHRQPPKPETWDDGPGICRWCGCCIFGLKGKNKGKPLLYRRWHSNCSVQYRFIFWPDYARYRLLEKRGYVCQDCGAAVVYRASLGYRIIDGKVYRKSDAENIAEMHHIIPLSEYQHDPQDPYAAWKEGNLVILCHDCHVGPYGRHAQLRAEKKRQMELF